MQTSVNGLLFKLLIGSALLGCSVSISADSTAIEDAKSAALDWLALIDDGQYRQSWEQAGSLFQTQIDAEQWEQAVDKALAPLGDVVDRSLESAKYAESLPGAPDGQYVVLEYATTFEHKQRATETLTMALNDGGWQAVGYFVR